MWAVTVLACVIGANPGDVSKVFKQSACGAPVRMPGGCYGHNGVPVTLCRLDNATCSTTSQMVVTELASRTNPTTGCHTYQWTWTCALDHRVCIDGDVCVCANHTATLCDCNVTNIYNGTEPCTSAPTAAPTAPTPPPPTSFPTTPPTFVPTTVSPTATVATQADDDGPDWSFLGPLITAVVLVVVVCVCLFFAWCCSRPGKVSPAPPRSHFNCVYDRAS